MSDVTPPATVAIGDVAAMMDRMWQEMVGFPFAQVCKHHAAGIVIQEMEELGIEPPVEIIRAVVFCDDDVSLAWERGQPEDLAKTDDQDIGKEKA